MVNRNVAIVAWGTTVALGSRASVYKNLKINTYIISFYNLHVNHNNTSNKYIDFFIDQFK